MSAPAFACGICGGGGKILRSSKTSISARTNPTIVLGISELAYLDCGDNFTSADHCRWWTAPTSRTTLVSDTIGKCSSSAFQRCLGGLKTQTSRPTAGKRVPAEGLQAHAAQRSQVITNHAAACAQAPGSLKFGLVPPDRSPETSERSSA